MSEFSLNSIDVNNFRSIRGRIHAPLDAKVVLIHGENGAGKTSLLSAIELALTGNIQSLEHADLNYKKQLLHRSATEGSVLLRAKNGLTEYEYETRLNASSTQSLTTLNAQRASFFRERAFLPQSLLGQLLQIYQDAGNDATSPLAQFVGKLLGLDRLDALEAGLKVLVDVRNVRKHIEGWTIAENDKTRLGRQISDQRKLMDFLSVQILDSINEISEICTALKLTLEVREETLNDVMQALSDNADYEDFARLNDQQHKLASIKREIYSAQSLERFNADFIPTSTDEAIKAFASWEAENGQLVTELRTRIEGLLPNVSLPNDLESFIENAIARLETEKIQLSARVIQARADIARYTSAQDEQSVALKQSEILDEELASLSNSSGSLGSALSELTSFITNDICPVCDRDFKEVSQLSLSEHVHTKVLTLSASAERLLTLGRTRSELHVTIEKLSLEVESIAARKLEDKTLAELDRRLAVIQSLLTDIAKVSNAIREGARLRTAAIAARRTVAASHSRNISLAVARNTLSDFGVLVGLPTLDLAESFETTIGRMETFLQAQSTNLESNLVMRRKGIDLITSIQSIIARRAEVKERISEDLASQKIADNSLEHAQSLRDAGNTIRNTVDKVRSDIIRREFNDRLNRVWRDLFVRLAPGEPFVPAFRIPQSATHKLQPKLITEYRDTGEIGGTPGSMLSAGNLNTAALTLFIALHLSVPKELPWLILDDPVQSMDDVHIAHFAALLKTLSKEHGRQIMIAVHDHQLFEYLKLELSPAFSDDSLLTLELSRGQRRDSVCIATRFSFKEETAFLTAAA
jgi:DNA repair protein SbcC/Rad50